MCCVFVQYVMRICVCVCAHVCVCVLEPFIAQSLRVGKLGRRRWHAVYSSEFARREVGASPMALLFPIPGVRGRVFAANEQSAWDGEVLRTLQPSLIINLTRKPCPGCALICLF